MSEVLTTNKDKLSWRERHASRKAARLAIKEAEAAAKNAPEKQILRLADRAIDNARKQGFWTSPVDTFHIDPKQFTEKSRWAKYGTRTMPVSGEHLGLDEHESVGLVATFNSKFFLGLDKFLDNGENQLYLAIYNDTDQTGKLQQITHESLAAMSPENLQLLLGAVEQIEAKEFHSYVEYKSNL